MRIIAGKFKGRNLVTQKEDSIRPTTDRVKENIFNLIQSINYENGNVLDLFCGCGALGIESLSRGANYCMFCDISAGAIDVLKKNLSQINAKFDVYHGDYSSAIAQASRTGLRFKLILLDPPYGKVDFHEILKRIMLADILEENGVIVIERPIGPKEYFLPSGLFTLDSREYGNTVVDVITIGDAVAVTGTFDPYTIGHDYLVTKALEQFDCVHIVLLDNPDKIPFESKKRRQRRIELAVRHHGKGLRIKVSSYKGLTIDYCKSNDIRYIVRGIRNPDDIKYEQEMAKWNEENGGIKTIFYEAINSHVSSEEVRKKRSKGEDISNYLVGD